MDRDEEIGVYFVGAVGSLDEALPGGRGGDQPNRLVETGTDERLLDLVGKAKIESVFGNAAGAIGAGHLGRMAHIDNDAEPGTLADRVRWLSCRQDALLAVRRMPIGTKEQDRDYDEGSRSGKPLAHDARDRGSAILDIIMVSSRPASFVSGYQSGFMSTGREPNDDAPMVRRLALVRGGNKRY